jgi:hypothetical protein
VRRSANLALSHDLTGFHFYGTDLCLIASILGYNAYVVDFHLRHKSGGTGNTDFFARRTQIVQKYARAIRPRWVRTTCTHLYISGSVWRSFLLNNRIALKLAFRFPKAVRAISKLL